MPKNITGSVGKGGMNRAIDSATVQYLLNCVKKDVGGPYPELAVDGICGPLTKAAILKFQMARGGTCDGRVDPKGWTIKTLQGYDPYPGQSMAACMGAKGYGKGAAAQKAASQAVLKGIGAAVARALAKSGGGVAGVAGATTGIVKKATEAAAKVLEQAAKQGGIPVGPFGSLGDALAGKMIGGMGGLVKKAAESAIKATEEAAKQAKVPFFPEHMIPNNPGFDRPPSVQEAVTKVSKIIEKIAEQAAEAAAKSGGKLPVDPVKLTGLDEVPAAVKGVIKQVSDTTNSVIDFIVKSASQVGKS